MVLVPKKTFAQHCSASARHWLLEVGVSLLVAFIEIYLDVFQLLTVLPVRRPGVHGHEQARADPDVREAGRATQEQSREKGSKAVLVNLPSKIPQITILVENVS